MKIAMFYFTGTGLTERVAEKLAAEFTVLENDVSLKYIPTMLRKTDDESTAADGGFSDFDRLGILYPVHSFNAPEIVVRFAKTLPEGNGRMAFIVKTAGGDSTLNHGSSLLLKKILARKGYNMTYEELIQMPSNFAVRPDDDASRRMIRNADDLAVIIAEEIVKGRKKVFRPGPGVRLAARLGRVEWTGAHMMGKFSLKAGEDCDMCGKCAAECPTDNISMEGGKISSGSECTFCMRCIYGCPQHAIHIKKPFSGIEVKNWFDIDELMADK